jgi:D-amino-acid dehydrogenase
MRTLVLGAGVIGLSAAYALATDGHDVTVLDQNRDVGQGASFANGAQLSYSYVAPFASPGVLRRLPGWMLAADSPIRFRPGLSPHRWAWAMRFLRAATPSRFRTTVQQLLALSSMSRELVHELVRKELLEFSFTQNGKLVIYSDEDAFRASAPLIELQRSLGCDQQVLDGGACLELEPALRHIGGRICGGVFTPSDETGDCERFCVALGGVLRAKYGVRFMFDTRLNALRSRARQVVAAATNRGDVEADRYVLALGTGSRAHTRPLGFDLPIIGMKGYSLTVPITGSQVPRISITDLEDKIVYAPLERQLRIAGIADLEANERHVRPERLALLERQARNSFPEGLDYAHMRTWVGARPVTPTGVPIIGTSPTMNNLFLNVGHGALGFTLAMASGRIVADRLAGKTIGAPLCDFVT